MKSRLHYVAVLAASSMVLAACAGAPADQAMSADKNAKVLTSFYPIHYLTERIGGDLLTVESLTPPGADAHHLELSPAKVAELGSAAAIVYASGFQSAVDEAVEANAPAHVIDVAPMVQLLPVTSDDDMLDDDHSQSDHHDHDHHDHDHGQSDDHDHHDHDHGQSDDHDHHDHDHGQSDDHDHDGHSHDHAAHDHDHDHGGMDPHFWLDPQRMAHAATAIGQALAKAFPENAQTFTQNAAAVAKDMNDLSAELVSQTQQCKQDSFVTAHKAFGYLADRAGLKQVGLSDVDPEAAPSPARLAQVSQFIRERGIKTVFSEHLVDPKVAETLAKDLGLTTATLDPLENQADPSKDYTAVMKENIATLHTALECQ